MQGFAAIAIGLLVVGSIVVGVRLLVLHLRTRGAPELLLGGMLLLAVGVGYPLMIATPRVSAAWAGLFQASATLAWSLGFSLLFVFTWRVFQPQTGWARVLAAAGVLTMLVQAVHRSVLVMTHGAFDASTEPVSEVVRYAGPVITAYAWTAWESLRYYAMMRRRTRVGLADAVVCNRFLLWGMMALVVNAGVIANIAATAMHTDTLDTPWVLLLSSTTGLTQVVLLVLAFLPPPSYTSWVRARSAARAA